MGHSYHSYTDLKNGFCWIGGLDVLLCTTWLPQASLKILVITGEVKYLATATEKLKNSFGTTWQKKFMLHIKSFSIKISVLPDLF